LEYFGERRRPCTMLLSKMYTKALIKARIEFLALRLRTMSIVFVYRLAYDRVKLHNEAKFANYLDLPVNYDLTNQTKYDDTVRRTKTTKITVVIER